VEYLIVTRRLVTLSFTITSESPLLHSIVLRPTRSWDGNTSTDPKGSPHDIQVSGKLMVPKFASRLTYLGIIVVSRPMKPSHSTILKLQVFPKLKTASRLTYLGLAVVP